MWIVKRMSTARIVILTITLNACGAAACLASGSDTKPLPTVPVAQLQRPDVREQAEARQAGPLSLALDSKSPKGRTI
jgi:Flp pilus assembly protein CpaB